MLVGDQQKLEIDRTGCPRNCADGSGRPFHHGISGIYKSAMQPTLDQLATGILHLGYEDEDTYPLSEIPFDNLASDVLARNPHARSEIFT
jgi:hypothetical protein